MKWDQAYKLMQEGKKITGENWNPEDYIFLQDGIIVNDCGADQLKIGINTGVGWLEWAPLKRYKVHISTSDVFAKNQEHAERIAQNEHGFYYDSVEEVPNGDTGCDHAVVKHGKCKFCKVSMDS